MIAHQKMTLNIIIIQYVLEHAQIEHIIIIIYVKIVILIVKNVKKDQKKILQIVSHVYLLINIYNLENVFLIV